MASKIFSAHYSDQKSGLKVSDKMFYKITKYICRVGDHGTVASPLGALVLVTFMTTVIYNLCIRYLPTQVFRS